MKIDILYEDDDIAAVDKPSGLMVHADGRREEMTVADWVLERYPQARDVGEPQRLSDGSTVARPGIVHRLDAETSGVLLIAKTQEGFAHLKEQFQNRTIGKEYRAFAWGVMKGDRGIIDRPIGKSRSDFRLYSAQRFARGQMRDAVTEYRVLQRGAEHTYLSLAPKTGRTHQLRVHLKAINHPIVCDALYAPKRPCALGFSRLALHAHTISFTTPSGKKISVESPLPEDFQRALTLMK